MNHPTELQQQMDRDEAERQRLEDAAWLEMAEQARKEGFASPERVAEFLKDFQNEEGEQA